MCHRRKTSAGGLATQPIFFPWSLSSDQFFLKNWCLGQIMYTFWDCENHDFWMCYLTILKSAHSRPLSHKQQKRFLFLLKIQHSEGRRNHREKRIQTTDIVKEKHKHNTLLGSLERRFSDFLPLIVRILALCAEGSEACLQFLHDHFLQFLPASLPLFPTLPSPKRQGLDFYFCEVFFPSSFLFLGI